MAADFIEMLVMTASRTGILSEDLRMVSFLTQYDVVLRMRFWHAAIVSMGYVLVVDIMGLCM